MMARHSSQRNSRVVLAGVLCKYKADVNSQVPDSLDTPLHITLQKSNYELAKLLVVRTYRVTVTVTVTVGVDVCSSCALLIGTATDCFLVACVGEWSVDLFSECEQ